MTEGDDPDSYELGLYLNKERIRSQRILEMTTAISLAMGDDAGATGEIMVAAGLDLADVSRWVMKRRISESKK